MQTLTDFIGRFIGIISVFLTGFGFIMLVRQIKKSNKIKASSHILSIIFSLIMFFFNIFVFNSVALQWWFILLILFGSGFGFAWGTTTKLNLQNNQVIGKRSVVYIFFWLASLGVIQILSLFAKTNVVAFGLAGMFFSTGASIGSNLNIVLRMRNLLIKQRPYFCTNCGNQLQLGDQFCRQCGTKKNN